MNLLKKFIDKCLLLSKFNDEWNNKLISGIIEAGRTVSYVETTNPTQSDTLHLAIKRGDSKTFMREYECNVRSAIAELKLKHVKIGFDTTEDVTWIKQGSDLRPSVYNQPLMSWMFLNVSIIDPIYLPLMSVPYRQIDDLDKLVIDLLNYIKTLPITVDLIVLDRGFYHAHLIDYLNGKRREYSYPYLILVPERKAQKKYIQQTRDANLFLASYKHNFKHRKDKSCWKTSATIAVRIVDDKIAWCYATNQKVTLKLVMNYPKRWMMETGFRVHDEARIKSKSKNLFIRFFYHLVSMLLIVLWKLNNKIKAVVFKRFLKQIEEYYTFKIKELLAPP